MGLSVASSWVQIRGSEVENNSDEVVQLHVLGDAKNRQKTPTRPMHTYLDFLECLLWNMQKVGN